MKMEPTDELSATMEVNLEMLIAMQNALLACNEMIVAKDKLILQLQTGLTSSLSEKMGISFESSEQLYVHKEVNKSNIFHSSTSIPDAHVLQKDSCNFEPAGKVFSWPREQKLQRQQHDVTAVLPKVAITRLQEDVKIFAGASDAHNEANKTSIIHSSSDISANKLQGNCKSGKSRYKNSRGGDVQLSQQQQQQDGVATPLRVTNRRLQQEDVKILGGASTINARNITSKKHSFRCFHCGDPAHSVYRCVKMKRKVEKLATSASSKHDVTSSPVPADGVQEIKVFKLDIVSANDISATDAKKPNTLKVNSQRKYYKKHSNYLDSGGNTTGVRSNLGVKSEISYRDVLLHGCKSRQKTSKQSNAAPVVVNCSQKDNSDSATGLVGNGVQNVNRNGGRACTKLHGSEIKPISVGVNLHGVLNSDMEFDMTGGNVLSWSKFKKIVKRCRKLNLATPVLEKNDVIVKMLHADDVISQQIKGFTQLQIKRTDKHERSEMFYFVVVHGQNNLLGRSVLRKLWPKEYYSFVRGMKKSAQAFSKVNNVALVSTAAATMGAAAVSSARAFSKVNNVALVSTAAAATTAEAEAAAAAVCGAHDACDPRDPTKAAIGRGSDFKVTPRPRVPQSKVLTGSSVHDVRQRDQKTAGAAVVHAHVLRVQPSAVPSPGSKLLVAASHATGRHRKRMNSDVTPLVSSNERKREATDFKVRSGKSPLAPADEQVTTHLDDVRAYTSFQSATMDSTVGTFNKEYTDLENITYEQDKLLVQEHGVLKLSHFAYRALLKKLLQGGAANASFWSLKANVDLLQQYSG